MQPGAALITGGAKRIGRAMALNLARRGWDVAVNYASSADEAADLVAKIRAMGRRAAAVHGDLLDPEQVAALVPAAVAALERPLTLLINNASIFEHDNIETATDASWQRHIGSNLRAPVFLTQAFAAQAPEAQHDDAGEPVARACVVNMIDQRVRRLTPEFLTYTIAKAGLWTFTRTAAQALSPNIRVNAIGPGPTVQGTRQSPEHFAAQRNSTILERGSDPGEICATLQYILSMPALTGQLLCLDGGQHLIWRTPGGENIE